VKPTGTDPAELRRYRNSKLYRSLTRTLRVYNRRLVAGLHAAGFRDFSPAFPQLLSNLDTEGTRVGVLAARAGITRQAAGQLLAEIERCGYVERRSAPDDARVTVAHFTARGRRLLATVFSLVEEQEAGFADVLGPAGYEAVRAGLARLADAVDPEGAFGVGDEAAAARPAVAAAPAVSAPARHRR
jgi:DNA-binding MarR family transcriptional regulator